MARITPFAGYAAGAAAPGPPKPEVPPEPTIATVQDGVPVAYPKCHGVGVRVVHPADPRAPARNMGLVLFYVSPHAVLEPGSHPTEESYVILEGEGRMAFARDTRQVQKGDFVYLPPWCVHGIQNTGRETLVVLICTSPPNPRGWSPWTRSPSAWPASATAASTG